MNLLEKMNEIKIELSHSIKKSGKNKFTGFDYFELGDFIPQMLDLCKKHKVFTSISFTDSLATLTITNAEKMDEQIIVTSPMSSASLKGCHDVQNLGAVQTYLRRYLYISAFDIVESDELDHTLGKQNHSKTENKKNNNHSKTENKKIDFTVSPKTGRKFADMSLEERKAVFDFFSKDPKKYGGYLTHLASLDFEEVKEEPQEFKDDSFDEVEIF